MEVSLYLEHNVSQTLRPIFSRKLFCLRCFKNELGLLINLCSKFSRYLVYFGIWSAANPTPSPRIRGIVFQDRFSGLSGLFLSLYNNVEYICFARSNYKDYNRARLRKSKCSFSLYVIIVR